MEREGYTVVLDEEDEPTPYYIKKMNPVGPFKNDDSYDAYVFEGDEAKKIARIRVHRNGMAPYENLDNGVLYDSIDYLCDKATDCAYR